jgi:hypothetical protein
VLLSWDFYPRPFFCVKIVVIGWILCVCVCVWNASNTNNENNISIILWWQITVCLFLYPHSPKGRGVYCFTSVRPSVQDIFRRTFPSNCWWQKSDIWSQASYRYTILWVAFLDPSYSYFLFADLVGFYTHWTYMLIFCRIFLSNYWWQRSDIWS